MSTRASPNDQRLFPLPIRSAPMPTRMNHLSTKPSLTGELGRHLGFPTSQPSGEDDMPDLHLPRQHALGRFLHDGDLPFVLILEESGLIGVEGGFAPAVDFENVDVGFHKVG